MANWTDLDPVVFLPDAPITSSQGIALAENVEALAEGAPNAPINEAGWHPYNAVTVNDGETGVIWDFAVDGAVANIVSPDFADGYEYRFLFDRVQGSVASVDARHEVFQEGAAAYVSPAVQFATSAIGSGGAVFMDGALDFDHPRRLARAYTFRADVVAGSTATFESTAGGVRFASLQRILRVRLAPSSGNFATGGRVIMLRRRDFTTDV